MYKGCKNSPHQSSWSKCLAQRSNRHQSYWKNGSFTFLTPRIYHLCKDHVISSGHWMKNFVSNFECLFWFFFQQILKSDLKEVKFTKNYLWWVETLLWFLKSAPNFKTRLRLKNITLPNIQNSTQHSSFDGLSEWHDPDITKGQIISEQIIFFSFLSKSPDDIPRTKESKFLESNVNQPE